MSPIFDGEPGCHAGDLQGVDGPSGLTIILYFEMILKRGLSPWRLLDF